MTARIAEEPPAVAKPPHKISELTTYELRDYRFELEKAIAFYAEQDLAPPARAEMQARLDGVIAEQDERARIARG